MSPTMSDAEFDAKPQVMLVGQYSVGKTSFIRYLIGKDFPGQRIGPEPTTDKFVAIFDGPDERIIPGNALAVSRDMPYKGLERFGVSFLNRFEGSQVANTQVLKSITLVDTPGVLSGEKQRLARGYDFTKVCSWFAARADLIILLFDAHKLDISDEFKAVILSLKGNDEKVRCILNKADQIDRQRLMRVYGALMWSLGKVVTTPEVLRVYIGSFWDQPLQFQDNKQLFEMEEHDLMTDLRDLPRNSAVRKMNELIKRVRLAKTHAYIISYLKEQMPSFMGVQKKQQELLADMGGVFRSVMKKYNIAPGDFPDIAEFQSKLTEQDFTKFHKLKAKLIEDVDAVLGNDFPRLMDVLPRSLLDDGSESIVLSTANTPTFDAPVRSTNKATAYVPVAIAQPLPQPPTAQVTRNEKASNPFAESGENPFGDDDWALNEFIPKYTPQFQSLQQKGLVSGGAMKGILSSSGLPKQSLRKIWELSDIDKDGSLNLYEFVICMFITDMAKEGNEVPEELDAQMYPPSR